MSSDVSKVGRIVQSAERLLVITGAGCSTGSGIGDYRGLDGAWKKPQPIQHRDFVNSMYSRQRYWARSMKGYPVFRAARPNPAHTYLVQLERSGRVSGLITQNVDRLHQQAGHKVVVDLHGRLDEVICLECGQISPRNDWQHWLIEHNPQLVQTQFQAAPDGDAEIELRDVSDVVVPHCLTCNGIVKPNVVFYGASVAPEVVACGYAMVEQADAMLVVGSSLMVYSSFRFVRAAYERGIPVVAINLGTTRADDMLTAKVQLDCATALAQIQGD